MPCSGWVAKCEALVPEAGLASITAQARTTLTQQHEDDGYARGHRKCHLLGGAGSRDSHAQRLQQGRAAHAGAAQGETAEGHVRKGRGGSQTEQLDKLPTLYRTWEASASRIVRAQKMKNAPAVDLRPTIQLRHVSKQAVIAR